MNDNYIPDILADNEELRAEVERLGTIITERHQQVIELKAELDEANICSARLFSNAGRLTEQRNDLQHQLDIVTLLQHDTEGKLFNLDSGHRQLTNKIANLQANYDVLNSKNLLTERALVLALEALRALAVVGKAKLNGNELVVYKNLAANVLLEIKNLQSSTTKL